MSSKVKRLLFLLGTIALVIGLQALGRWDNNDRNMMKDCLIGSMVVAFYGAWVVIRWKED